MNIELLQKIINKVLEENGTKKELLRAAQLLSKPGIYHSKREQWYLFGILMEILGCKFDLKKQEISLYWGIKDETYFLFLQSLVNGILGINTNGIYDKISNTWILKFG